MPTRMPISNTTRAAAGPHVVSGRRGAVVMAVVSHRTVENHVAAVLRKLNVSTRDEAVGAARARGVLDAPSARPEQVWVVRRENVCCDRSNPTARARSGDPVPIIVRRPPVDVAEPGSTEYAQQRLAPGVGPGSPH